MFLESYNEVRVCYEAGVCGCHQQLKSLSLVGWEQWSWPLCLLQAFLISQRPGNYRNLGAISRLYRLLQSITRPMAPKSSIIFWCCLMQHYACIHDSVMSSLPSLPPLQIRFLWYIPLSWLKNQYVMNKLSFISWLFFFWVLLKH